MRFIITIACLLTATLAAQTTTTEIKPTFPLAITQAVDFDADGKSELLVIGRDGEVRVYRRGQDGQFIASESWSLSDPSHSLIAIASFADQEGKRSLVVVDRKGCRRHDFLKDGLSKKGKRLARRARNTIRGGRPLLANVVRDVDANGALDLVIPSARRVELWLAGDKGYRRAAEIDVAVKVRSNFDGVREKGFVSNEITIPDLDMRDLDGDGRDDLVVNKNRETRFHLLKADGTLPVEPDVVLDLDKFKDTTAKATVKPGYTLAGTERASSLIRDIDGDGIPDYLVAHRRKVWIFRGTTKGPQFTRPTSIVRTADDMTGIWLAKFDDDDKIDLMIVRIQVPSIASLITGFLGSIKVEFSAFGYRNEGDLKFSKKPTWTRDLTFVLPSLTEILKNPDAILKRFEEAGKKFRRVLEGDFNGDGREDIGLVAEDGKRLDLWSGAEGDVSDDDDPIDGILRELLFDQGESVWDLDRMVEWFGSLGSREAARVTKNRKAEQSIDLPDPLKTPLRSLIAGDFDGDKKDEIVLVFEISPQEDPDLCRIQFVRR